MRAFAVHASFEFRSGLRDRSLMLMNYLFPVGLYLLLGFLMGALSPDFSQNIIPIMVVVAMLSSMILGLPNPLVAAREAGIFRSYRINGVPAASILIIPALTTTLHMLIVAIIITVTAPLLFGTPLPPNWGGAIVFFLLTAFASAGLGLLIGVVSANTRAAMLCSQRILVPSMLLGGLMMPASVLPAALGKIGMLLPSTYAMDLYHGLASGKATAFDPVWSALILLAGGVIAFALSVFLFCWDSQNRKRRGHPALAVLALAPYVIGMILL